MSFAPLLSARLYEQGKIAFIYIIIITYIEEEEKGNNMFSKLLFNIFVTDFFFVTYPAEIIKKVRQTHLWCCLR